MFIHTERMRKFVQSEDTSPAQQFFPHDRCALEATFVHQGVSWEKLESEFGSVRHFPRSYEFVHVRVHKAHVVLVRRFPKSPEHVVSRLFYLMT